MQNHNRAGRKGVSVWGIFFSKLLLFHVVEICSRQPYAPNSISVHGKQRVYDLLQCIVLIGWGPTGPGGARGSEFSSGSADGPPNLWSDLGRSLNLPGHCSWLTQPFPIDHKRNSLNGEIFTRGNEWMNEWDNELHQLPSYSFIHSTVIDEHLLYARYYYWLQLLEH